MWCFLSLCGAFFRYVVLFSSRGAFVRADIELTKVEFFEDRGDVGVDVSITLKLQINNGRYVDTNHKLVRWHRVIFGTIDWFSQLPVALSFSDNNKAPTFLQFFTETVSSSVKGLENVLTYNGQKYL